MSDHDTPDAPQGASAHELLNPATMSPAPGFSHVVRPAPGQLLFLAGQTAHQPDGSLRGEDFLTQFDAACGNVVLGLQAAGARPEDLVWLQIFTTDVDTYLAESRQVGRIYRGAFGRHFPAMSMFGVSRLVDPAAIVELVTMAVVPEPRP